MLIIGLTQLVFALDTIESSLPDCGRHLRMPQHFAPEKVLVTRRNCCMLVCLILSFSILFAFSALATGAVFFGSAHKDVWALYSHRTPYAVPLVRCFFAFWLLLCCSSRCPACSGTWHHEGISAAVPGATSAHSSCTIATFKNTSLFLSALSVLALLFDFSCCAICSRYYLADRARWLYEWLPARFSLSP